MSTKLIIPTAPGFLDSDIPKGSPHAITPKGRIRATKAPGDYAELPMGDHQKLAYAMIAQATRESLGHIQGVSGGTREARARQKREVQQDALAWLRGDNDEHLPTPVRSDVCLEAVGIDRDGLLEKISEKIASGD